MTALQPSDKTRFKDASEAEQALREAWDRCLTQGLVHPAILTMEEMAHDKVGPRMHEVRGAKASSPMGSVIGADSAEVTAIDSKLLRAAGPVSAAALQIEAVKKARAEDDDPTTVVLRDELHPPKNDATVRGVVPSAVKPPTPDRRAEKSGGLPMPMATAMPRDGERSRRGDESGAPTIEEKAIVDVLPGARPVASARAIWIAIALVLLVAGGIAAAYYLGYIK
jgi:hypothetical protein